MYFYQIRCKSVSNLIKKGQNLNISENPPKLADSLIEMQKILFLIKRLQLQISITYIFVFTYSLQFLFVYENICKLQRDIGIIQINKCF